MGWDDWELRIWRLGFRKGLLAGVIAGLLDVYDSCVSVCWTEIGMGGRKFRDFNVIDVDIAGTFERTRTLPLLLKSLLKCQTCLQALPSH